MSYREYLDWAAYDETQLEELIGQRSIINLKINKLINQKEELEKSMKIISNRISKLETGEKQLLELNEKTMCRICRCISPIVKDSTCYYCCGE